MDIIIDLINKYGLNTVILALVINILTQILKLPIKSLAKKIEDSSIITRFIVFMPIIPFFVFLNYFTLSLLENNLKKKFLYHIILIKEVLL